MKGHSFFQESSGFVILVTVLKKLAEGVIAIRVDGGRFKHELFILFGMVGESLCELGDFGTVVFQNRMIDLLHLLESGFSIIFDAQKVEAEIAVIGCSFVKTFHEWDDIRAPREAGVVHARKRIVSSASGRIMFVPLVDVRIGIG